MEQDHKIQIEKTALLNSLTQEKMVREQLELKESIRKEEERAAAEAQKLIRERSRAIKKVITFKSKNEKKNAWR